MMSIIISVTGKGGTGKTTISGLLIDAIARRKPGPVLAVDADPNSTLPDMLGVKEFGTVVDIVDNISSHLDTIPPGMTKDRFIDLKVQEAVMEKDSFDLLVMGRPEGPGCYCYVNNLLRDLIRKLTESYQFVVVDNEAGMEHISRRTTRVADRLLVVSDCSLIGVRSAKRIFELAKDIGIKIGKAYLAVNKKAGEVGPLTREIEKLPISFAGFIPQDEEIVDLALSGGSILGLKSQEVRRSIEKIVDTILA